MSVGLNPAAVSEQIEASGYHPDSRIDVSSMKENEKLRAFFESIKTQVLENSAEEDECLGHYILQALPRSGKVGFVDIGWSGSTQRALRDKCFELGLDVEIWGYYTGLRAAPGKEPDRTAKMKGFLFGFDADASILDRQGVYNALYEIFFGAQHGSVRRFTVEEGKAIPVLEEYELEGTDSKVVVQRIQQAALDYVDMAVRHNLASYVPLDPGTLLSNFERLGINPSLEEAEVFGSFVFLDYELTSLAEPMKMLDAIKNPGELVRDLNACYWKPAYLKRLFKIPLPYGEVIAKAKSVL